MNKSGNKIASLFLSALTMVSMISVGGNGVQSLSASAAVDGNALKETRPVVFATEALDGNFNPFFATSGPDSEMASMTQIGMLTTDKTGNITCGEDEPTVALSYDEKETTENGKKYTDYSFVIKNGIKFSDGKDLTIKDVLFNLYVYLDPAYMGSATMYSTDIVGLKSYRSQVQDAEDSNSNLEAAFEAAADDRMERLQDYLYGDTTTETEEIKSDIEKIKTYFREVAESDWTACQGQYDGYKDEYTFDEENADWQIYYLNEGILSYVSDTASGNLLMECIFNEGGTHAKDDNGKEIHKYITTLTPAGAKYELDGRTHEYDGKSYRGDLIEEIQAIKDQYTDETAQKEAIKEFAVAKVYKTYIGDDEFTNLDGMQKILYKVADELFNDFVSDARMEALGGSDLEIPTISGITTSKTTVDGEEHDVLNIRINDVDPKAIYNFSFAVAPMHYYSGEFEGVDYVAKADGKTNFGVKWGDKEFFDGVLQNSEKNKKPVGAGVYMASNASGATTNVKGSEFYNNNWVYFARNDYFETVGSGVYNANIKYLRYKVTNSDKLLQALKSKDIDIGEPNATSDNITEISDVSHLAQKTVATNGYGYVGVNPKFVPDIEVRQAIMKAMDLNRCIIYYSEENADILYRSMSKESWVWDYIEEATPYYEYTRKQSEIKALVEEAGWTISNGVYTKDGKTLKLTFTIAGSTTDHPAYTMFSDAADFLEKCGFEINVTTDIMALSKLATGDLQVWAAAWNSTVDPDMYQVYHKDSKATSVKNWGYPTILDGDDAQFGDEKKIINELSDLIDEGRTTTNKQVRAQTYEKALNKVMELAVELPTYQRNDCVCYNKEIISVESLNDEPTPFAGVIDRIWELNYVGADNNVNNTPVTGNGGNGGLSVGAIIGILIGGAAVIGVGAFAVQWFVVKKKTFADLVAVFKKK